jgi:tRNA A37 threonylcarbamoyladenosine dehydratase
MDQFARIGQLLGKEAMEKIHQARVAVFGLGAVGSFALEALARSGVGYLRLVDFDTIDPTNLNRQLLALHSTLGQKKAILARDRVMDIHPACQVEIHDAFVNARSLDRFLSSDLDLVVDAIDGLNAKVNLIFEARSLGLEVVASMGAAGRTDIAMIRTGDLSETCVCPLARMVRQRLHRRGLYQGVHCVYSVEKPLNKQPFDPEDLWDPLAGPQTPAGHGRFRPPLGTAVWVPGTFGLALAARGIEILTS